MFEDDTDLQIKGSFAPNPDKMQRMQAEDLRRSERRNAQVDETEHGGKASPNFQNLPEYV